METTYGLKKVKADGRVLLLTSRMEFVPHRFVGIGASRAKEWKTQAGAKRVATRLHLHESETITIFPITNTMHY